MSIAYDDYLQSQQWKDVSLAVKRRAGFRCQICNSQHDLQAHHRTYEHRGNEMQHLDDLTCLCRRCHAIFHGVIPPPPQKRIHVPERKPIPTEILMMTARQKRNLEHRQNNPPYDHEADLPKEFPFKITKEFIRLIHTHRGGLTKETIKAIGVGKKDMVKGWLHGLIGREITREQALAMLRGREVVT